MVMKEILEVIYKTVYSCEDGKDLFHLPSEVQPFVVSHNKADNRIDESWRLEKDNQWLELEYKSVERYSSFGYKPDRSHLSIKGEILKDGQMVSVTDYISWDESC